MTPVQLAVAWLAVAAVLAAALAWTGHAITTDKGHHAVPRGRRALAAAAAAADDRFLTVLRGLPSDLRARRIPVLVLARVHVAAYRAALTGVTAPVPHPQPHRIPARPSYTGPIPAPPLAALGTWQPRGPLTGPVVGDQVPGSPALAGGLDHLQRRWADDTGSFTAVQDGDGEGRRG